MPEQPGVPVGRKHQHFAPFHHHFSAAVDFSDRHIVKIKLVRLHLGNAERHTVDALCDTVNAFCTLHNQPGEDFVAARLGPAHLLSDYILQRQHINYSNTQLLRAG